MEIIGLIIAGIGISLLGKRWLAPAGRDDIGTVTTAVCGVAGVLVGWYAAAGTGIATGGDELARLTVSILLGSALAALAAIVTGRSMAGRL
jgi:hypothetical protein